MILRLQNRHICLEAVVATEINKIFSSWQPCQVVQTHQYFRDWIGLQNVGVFEPPDIAVSQKFYCTTDIDLRQADVNTVPQRKLNIGHICYIQYVNILYTQCTRRNLPHFKRMIFRLICIDKAKHTCTWSWTVMEKITRKVLKTWSYYTFTDYHTHIKTGWNL